MNPEAASSLAAKVALMAKIGACWSPSFSPDGQQIAFISNLNGRPQVWTMAAAGGWPRLVTALDDQIFSAEWSPDGQWLAFNLAPGGGLNTQVYIVRPDGTDMRLLTDGGATNNWLGFWTRDSRYLAIASNRRSADAMDSYLLDAVTGEHLLVAENQGVGVITDVSRDNRFCVVDRLVNRGDNNLYLVDRATGRETLLTPHDGPGNFTQGRFSPDARTIYIGGDYERELGALFRVRVDADGVAGAMELLAGRDDAELDGCDLTADGHTLMLSWNVSGRAEIEFLDAETGARRAGPALPHELIAGFRFSPGAAQDAGSLALALNGSTAPNDIWLYSMAGGDLRQITFSPHAGVDLSACIAPERVDFPAHDGLALSGWLYLPRDFAAPGPVVLSFHGGPEGQEVPRFSATYQALLAEGIAVFGPNVRGSTGFGKTFVNLDNGALRVTAVRDIESCVRALVERGIAAPGQIGIMGGSYGGYMTMAGITEFPDLFAAAANLFGIVNFRTFFQHTEPWMAAISKIEYGDPETEGAMLDSLSPIFRLDRVKAATLVLHGANDTNVPVIEAEQVVDHLRRHRVDVEYLLFPDEGHGFLKEPNRIQAAVAIVSWFSRYLKRAES